MLVFYSKVHDHKKKNEILKQLLEASPSIISFIQLHIGHHGEGKKALSLFQSLVKSDNQVNEETITITLNALSHSGMVNEAIQIKIFHKPPSLFHKSVMVDVFSRAGRFSEAEACAAPYLLLLHIYMLKGQNDKANKIRDILTQRGVKKIPGIVYHEEGKNTYQFISGAINYSLFNEVEQMRKEIYRKIKSSGYEPDTRWVTNTQSMTDEEKLNSLCRHAEKLAIALAFVLNPKRKSIILSSNIRMCNDCHNATALISKMMKCEIIVRDSNRYHHFKDGQCSCDNYW